MDYYRKKPGLVSVVIPTYNRAQMICDALDGLKRQTYKNIEVIIIDDCSTDDTETAINKWNNYNKDAFKDFIYLKLPRNRDEWWAWNIGFTLAKGEYIAIHSSDDISDERRFEIEVDYLNSNIDTAVVGSNYKVFKENLKNIIGVADWLIFDTNEIEIKYRKFCEHCVSSGTVLFRTDILDTIIGFRKITNNMNDYYFIEDIINHDYIVSNINEYLYYIREHEGQKSKMLEDNNSKIVDDKYTPKALETIGDRVSTIIVLENGSSSIISTLENISNQTYKNLELIIIDNKFDTILENRIIKWWLTKKDKKETAIKDLIYFKLPRRVQYPWTLNIGAYLAKGEYIAFQGESGISDVFRMEKQVRYLKDNPLTSVVGTNYVSSGNYAKDNNIQNDEDLEYSYIVNKMPCMNTNTMMLRAKVINYTGGLCRRIIGREAFEFIYSLLKRGFGAQNLREVLYYE